MLALLEAEAADRAEGTDRPTASARQEGLSAVFNHGDPALVCERHDVFHLTGIPKEMGNDDRFRSRRESRLDGAGGDVARTRIDIREYGNRALVEDRGERAHVSDGCRYDLVSGLRVDCGHRAVDRGRARGARIGVPGAEEGSEIALERLGERALGARECSAPDRLAHEFDLFGSECSPRGVLVGGQLERRLGAGGTAGIVRAPLMKLDSDA